MARHVPQALSQSGALGMSGPYTPGRFYGPHGLGGSLESAGPGLAVSPFLLRPGRHRIVGLWQAFRSQSPNISARLGLWADNGSGQPGALIKDTGVVTFSSQGVLRVDFDPIEIAGPAVLYTGVVTDALAAQMLSPRVSSAISGSLSVGDPLAEVGLTLPVVVQTSAGAILNTGWRKSDFAVGTALADSPDLNGATACGSLNMGLIFGV